MLEAYVRVTQRAHWATVSSLHAAGPRRRRVQRARGGVTKLRRGTPAQRTPRGGACRCSAPDGRIRKIQGVTSFSFVDFTCDNDTGRPLHHIKQRSGVKHKPILILIHS
ncbi:hypothetical protein B5X24_HaOG213159 [Helicoverpa armigera]|nr:hypothetical protein B5X24_HaOG213159 [Helicoverpa armigera]